MSVYGLLPHHVMARYGSVMRATRRSSSRRVLKPAPLVWLNIRDEGIRHLLPIPHIPSSRPLDSHLRQRLAHLEPRPHTIVNGSSTAAPSAPRSPPQDLRALSSTCSISRSAKSPRCRGRLLIATALLAGVEEVRQREHVAPVRVAVNDEPARSSGDVAMITQGRRCSRGTLSPSHGSNHPSGRRYVP